MNCNKHPALTALEKCSNCQTPMCEECLALAGGQKPVCIKCQAMLASKEVGSEIEKERSEAKERHDESQQEKKRKKKSILAIQAAIILAAIVVAVIQIPAITESLQAEQPVRIGTYETNSITDQCIEILWKTAKGLQDGILPGPDNVCPASNKPLVVSEENGDLIVRVPDPERYGFREIRVTKTHPVPELIR